MNTLSLSPETAWKAALGELEMQMTRATFMTWLQGTRALSWADGEFVIGVRSDFAKDWLENRLYDLIARVLSGVTGRPTCVRFAVWSDEIIAPKTALANGAGRADVIPVGSYNNARNGRSEGVNGAAEEDNALNRRYTFPTFVVGPNNRLAHAAALSVAENPGQFYNPLFIYGGVGLGKTHLLHAIGHYSRNLYSHLKVRYVNSEEFTNDFINSLRDDRKVAFKRSYRDIDVLLVDDIQFIEGKEGIQEEFFHTFNTLYEANRQIVLSSDRPPDSIATLEDRLRSRFKMGLITDIQPPDFETRLAIVRKKSEQSEFPLPGEVLEFIVTNITNNIRELEGALNRVTAYANLTRTPVTMDSARQVLGDLSAGGGRIVTPERILEATSEFYGFSIDELKSKSRRRPLVTARQVGMYLFRELTELSYPQIAKIYGGRDHTTVIHAYEKIKALMAERSSALVGMHPQFRQIPPRFSRSTIATFRPS